MFRLPLATVVCTLALAGCLPEAKFNATVRVLDEKTGKPIPNALVLVGAYVTVDPPFEPLDRPMGAARAMTGADGAARISALEGMYATSRTTAAPRSQSGPSTLSWGLWPCGPATGPSAAWARGSDLKYALSVRTTPSRLSASSATFSGSPCRPASKW